MPGKPGILVVDDEKEICTFFKNLFINDYEVKTAISGAEAAKAVGEANFDLAFVDLKLGDTSGLNILQMIKTKQPRCRVIIMTGYSTISTAIQAIQQGAFNYIEKPFDNLEYLTTIASQALGDQEAFSFSQSAEEGFVIGTNSEMRNVVSLARKIASKKLTVLIEGETGTGKEVMARFIHRYSDRAHQPFLAVNCGALSETLLESELFGHEKGAYTGASSVRRGIFEMANGGTLFLDEISQASPALQIKLLRMLENDEITRVGGERPIKCDVRLIAATNLQLQEAVKMGRFREDLFFRLNVINLSLPPLRERQADIPHLIDYVVRTRFPVNNIKFSQQTMKILQNYSWPGNIRELINMVISVLEIFDGNQVLPEHIPSKIRAEHGSKEIRATEPGYAMPVADDFLHAIESGQEVDLDTLIRELKIYEASVIKKVIQQVIVSCGDNQGQAAAWLNISQRRLQYYLNEKL